MNNIMTFSFFPLSAIKKYGFLLRGNIFFELDGNAAPITAGNFVDLVNRGVYKGTSFNRVIKRPFPFIIQGE